MTWLAAQWRTLAARVSILLAAVLLALAPRPVPVQGDDGAVQALTGRIEPGRGAFHTVAHR